MRGSFSAKSVTRGVMSEMEKWGELGRNVLTSSSSERLSGGVGVQAGVEHSYNGKKGELTDGK